MVASTPLINNTVSSTTQSASNASSSSASAANSAQASYNSFLQLLITEMKNQDPTQPMDPTQTVTQLATFSGVQQQVQTNTLLTSLLSNSSLSQASLLVGQSITSSDGKTSGTVQSVSLTSTGMVATLTNGSSVPLTSGVTVS